MERYSAANLVKRSAAQLVYLKNRAERAKSRRLLNGEQYQSKVVKDESLSGIVADEMRGCYAYDDVEIFFCIDMIKDGEFYEIKSIQDEDGNETTEYPDWYLHSSVLQCAFYKSLLLNMDSNMLFTPKFRLKEGYDRVCMEINKQNNYYLKFGEVGTYKVNVLNPTAIIDFYKMKIQSLSGYGPAKLFDSKYKFKEYSVLSEHFIYTQCL